MADSSDPHGPLPHASKSLLIMRKQMISPPNRFDPPATSSHARECFLYYAEKRYLSLTARTHQLYYDPFHENIDCTKDAKLFPFYSNSNKKKLKDLENMFACKEVPPYYEQKNGSPC